MSVNSKILFLIGVVFLSCFSLGENARALTISPPVREMIGDPGSKVSGIIKLYNETNRDISVFPSTTSFGAKETGDGEPEFFELETGEVTDLASWIKIPAGPFDIRSLDWQNVIFEIEIPKDAEPGGHYAAIFFSPQKSDSEESGAVSVDYKTGTLILLTVSGETKEEGKLKEFFLKDNKKFHEHIPVSFKLNLENTGNVHFKPAGTVAVKNIFGGNVTELPILKTDSGGNVLPRSSRQYEITWGEIDGKKIPSTFWEKVKYEWNNFYVGRYSALVSVMLPGNKQEVASVSFWVIPWQLLGIIILALLLSFWLFGRYNRWIIKKAREKK